MTLMPMRLSISAFMNAARLSFSVGGPALARVDGAAASSPPSAASSGADSGSYCGSSAIVSAPVGAAGIGRAALVENPGPARDLGVLGIALLDGLHRPVHVNEPEGVDGV